MPFFSRDRTVSGDVPAATTSSQVLPISRHLRKNSKAARILGITSAPEDSSNANTHPNYDGIMSPPLLPMDPDPFSSRPLGALVIGSRNPTSQTQALQPPQHVPQPALRPPSAPVPAERPTAHTSTQRVYATHGAHRLPVGSDAQHIPRSQARAGSTTVSAVSARSRSHPPPVSSVPGGPGGTLSQPPLHHSPSSTNLRNTREHGSTSTHTNHQSDGLGPRVRDAAVTPRKRYRKKYDPAPTPVPRLRKAHSSFVLSSHPVPPLHAPKPLKLTGQPSVEILHVLAETETSQPNDQKAPAATAARQIWPPAPVIRPWRVVMPPRAEQDAFRAAAIEADKAYRKVCYERGLLEHVRSDRGREARRGGERDPNHDQRSRRPRRAATENSRRRDGREVEYRTMADYGYYATDQLWAGRAW
jgi:hypothetical protein